MTDFVYDEETYFNLFSCAVINAENDEEFTFEVSPRCNEWKQLVGFVEQCKKDGDRLVGFNNEGFDYPVLHHLLEELPLNASAESVYRAAYLKANRIIATPYEDRYSNRVWDSDKHVAQVDLFLIHHFDNEAKNTGLKAIEFAMRSHNLVDLPFPPDTELDSDQIDVVLEYNRHDTRETLKFYRHSKEQIDFRATLNEKFEGLDFTNFNDTKIGKQVFIWELEKNIGAGICFTRERGKGKKPRQTRRSEIALSEVILPVIQFSSPQFKAVHEWMASQVIRQTKGVFSDIEEHLLGDLAQHAVLTEKKKKFKTEPTQKDIDEFLAIHPAGWVEERQLKSGKVSYWKHWRIAEALNTTKEGVNYVFGTGGLHASVESTTVEADDQYEIIDFDVTSYYPSIAIENRLFPLHLTERFCDIYADLKTQRVSYKKGTAENAMLKLALNGTYGETNNQYSPFYDPKFTMSITVNGQLLLCMLVEDLLMGVPGLCVIQANTDGITVRVPRKERVKQRMYQITADWERRTMMKLEEAHYSKMFILNVNNYLAVYTDD